MQDDNSTTLGASVPGTFSAEPKHKISSNLIAWFAISGHSVHRLADGGFIVCKHGYAKHCPDVEALAAFAKLTGVTR